MPDKNDEIKKITREKLKYPEFQHGVTLMLRGRVRTSADRRRTVHWPVLHRFRRIA